MKKTVFLHAMLLIGTLLLTQSCKKDPVQGCSNPLAENFEPNADEDDGSCIIKGCTNPDSENYNPDANSDDGSCIIKGCNDSEAINYNPDATEDDGSCTYRKDSFLGTFKGGAECDNALLTQAIGGQELTFNIIEIDGENNKVTVEVEFDIELLDQSPEGSIDENQVLTFEQEQKMVEIDITMDGVAEVLDVRIKGTFTLDEETMNILSGPMEIEVKDSASGVTIILSTCMAEAFRQ